jgi:hypothetical protein
MTPLPKFEELTKEQVDLVCNGCGSRGFKAPNWFMYASCQHHDYGYYRGHTELDRLNCDRTFLREMKRDVSASKWYLRPIRYAGAYAYYLAVRQFGKKSFYYAPEYRTKEQIAIDLLINKKKFVG